MKILIRSTDGENTTEREVSKLESANVELMENEILHICRHEEGLPCSLSKSN